MQKSDLEDLWFYQFKDGSADQVAMQLNCFEASVYHIIKNSTKLDRKLIVPLFIRDINPTLWYNNTTGIFRIYNLSKNITPLATKYIKTNQYVKKHKKDSVNFIEGLMDKGQMVILQTAFERVRFYHKYDPEYDLSEYNQGIVNHVNILLYHEDDIIYFVEKIPYTINKKNYVPYEFNRQIGVVNKSEIEEACNFFIRCHTVHLDEHELIKNASFRNDILNLLHAIADNYIGSIEQDGEYTRYSGVKALEKFAEFCDKGFDLNNYYSTKGWTMLDRISFDIWMIHGSRAILLEYLKLDDSGTESSEDLKLLRDTIEGTRAQWAIIERILTKMIQSKSTQLNAKIGNRIRNLIAIENKLYILLKKFS